MHRGYDGVALVALFLALASPTSARAQEVPTRGGTLVVAISADPGHLNPAITTSGATHTAAELIYNCLLYTSPSPRDRQKSRMPSSA